MRRLGSGWREERRGSRFELVRLGMMLGCVEIFDTIQIRDGSLG